MKRFSLKEISMNKIMATAALLVATTIRMATTAMAEPGWSHSTHGREIQGGYVAGPVHGADRYRHYVAPPREYYGYGRAWHRGERFAPYGGRVEVLRGYRHHYGHGRVVYNLDF
jgi:hypothetical protein